MADYEVNQSVGGVGPNGAVMHAAVTTVSHGGTYDTGLSTVDTAVATGTTSDTNVSISGNSDGTLTLAVQTAGSDATDEDVHIIAVGDR